MESIQRAQFGIYSTSQFGDLVVDGRAPSVVHRDGKGHLPYLPVEKLPTTRCDAVPSDGDVVYHRRRQTITPVKGLYCHVQKVAVLPGDGVYLIRRTRVLGTVLLPPLIKIPQLFANLNKNHYICTMTIAKPIINIE